MRKNLSDRLYTYAFIDFLFLVTFPFFFFSLFSLHMASFCVRTFLLILSADIINVFFRLYLTIWDSISIRFFLIRCGTQLIIGVRRINVIELSFQYIKLILFQLQKAVGHEITRIELVPIFLRLLKHTHVDIRRTAAYWVGDFCHNLCTPVTAGDSSCDSNAAKISKEIDFIIMTSILPIVKGLVKDPNENVRMALSAVIFKLSPILGKQRYYNLVYCICIFTYIL